MKNKLISLKVKNFKSFADFEINLNKQNVNLIYGDNGSGKSTFIEIFDFLVNL